MLKKDYSKVGYNLGQDSVITKMSADINLALKDRSIKSWYNLGVGNPLITKDVREFWQDAIDRLATEDVFNHICRYGGAYGLPQLRDNISKLFNELYGWNIEPENVLISNGSQTLFFMLINLFSGSFEDGSNKKVLIPLLPEYVGFNNLGVEANGIDGKLPLVKSHNSQEFSYRINFDNLNVSNHDHGAILTSRPRNPTGGVIDKSEFENLISLSETHSIPLLVDSAYSSPFPDLCYSPISLTQSENILYSFSLSKCGLPGERIGIAIGSKDLIRALSNFQCNTSISPSVYGQLLGNSVIQNRKLMNLCQKTLKPLYWRKKELAVNLLSEHLKGINWSMHKFEGGMFLWIKFDHKILNDLKIYEASKKQGLILVPGSSFFFGKNHKIEEFNSCIRLSLTVTDDELVNGIRLLASVISKLLNT